MRLMLAILCCAMLSGCMTGYHLSSDFAKRKECFFPTDGFVHSNRLVATGFTQVWNSFADASRHDSYIVFAIPTTNYLISGEVAWVDPGTVAVPPEAIPVPVLKGFDGYKDKQQDFERNGYQYAIYDSHIFFKTADGQTKSSYFSLSRKYLPGWNYPVWTLALVGNVLVDVVTLPVQIILIALTPDIHG